MAESKSAALTNLATPQSVVQPVRGERMPIQSADRDAAPRPGNLRCDHACLALRPERREHARSRPAHPRIPERLQPAERLSDLRVAPARLRLEIVRASACEKGRNFERFRISCQRVRREDFARGDSDLRGDHDVPGGVQIERRQDLADALGEGVPPEQEERDVGAEAEREPRELARAAGPCPRARSARSGWSPHRSSRRPGRRRPGSASRPGSWPAAATPAARWSARAARTARSSSSGTPSSAVASRTAPSGRGANSSVSQRSMSRKTVCSR